MNSCIFCKIINGEFGTEFVYENEYAVVFKDINPKADIHLLVVPRLHVEKKLGIKSYKTLINTGKEAGQEVFHLHIHILSGKLKMES